jgi:hypothetical protein
MSSNNGPFGIDPEDFDRVVREAGEGLREAFETVSKFIDGTGQRAGWASFLDDIVGGQRPKPTPEPGPKAGPESTEQTSGGVWVIYTLDDDGSARIDEAYPTELDALRAHKTNTDPTRKVRFLPYGVTVSLLDAVDE